MQLKVFFGWDITGSYIIFNENHVAAMHYADLDSHVRSFMDMDQVQPNNEFIDV